MSTAQKHLVAHCLRMPGTSTQLDVQRAGFVESAEFAA